MRPHNPFFSRPPGRLRVTESEQPMVKPHPDNALAPELEFLTPMVNRNGTLWEAQFRGLTLRTALQPIYSVAHKRIVGYEALIRGFDRNNAPVPPLQLFQLPTSDMENLVLDRLCRILHIHNYQDSKDRLNWLFLNVSPRVVSGSGVTDSFFERLLKKTGLEPHRIVIEIVEQPTTDSDKLREAVAYYKKLGCLTAIDDFGSGHSNFERIWNLSPDIVKLDRSLLSRATGDPKARQIIVGIVSLLHQSGCLVLLEGVESRDQAILAIDAGADFVQGFYFRRPSTCLEQVMSEDMDFEELLEDYKSRSQVARDPGFQLLDFFRPRFLTATRELCSGANLSQACQNLLNHHTVSRCYLVNRHGLQIEESLISESTRELDPRFRPLENTANADWFRKKYLRQALAQPEALQVTAPYLCVTGAYMCITLSQSYYHDGELRVLCCDVLPHQPPTKAL